MMPHIFQAPNGRYKLAAHEGSPEIWLGIPHVVDERAIRAPWKGHRDGRSFRCGMCAKFFELGEVYYLVVFYGQVKTTRWGNFLCHQGCVTPDLVARRLAAEVEVDACLNKHWWADDDEKQKPSPAFLKLERKGS